MKFREVATLLSIGVILWPVGTAYYEFRGPAIFETTPLQYWLNLVLAPILTVFAFVRILRSRRVPSALCAHGALLLLLPGLFGEALLLSNAPRMLPRFQAVTAARYGGFLFAGYAVVLAVALAISLRAVKQTVPDQPQSASPY